MSVQMFLLLLVVVAGALHTCNGSHFRGGSLSWKPVGSGRKVHFTFRLGFRRSSGSSFYCDQSRVNNRTVVPGSGSSWMARQCSSYHNFCGSISIGSVGYVCTDFSVTEDWSQGENSFNFDNFTNEGPWFVGYSSCCWISLSSGGGSWYLSSTVNLTRRSDTGTINSSPVSAISPIVRLQWGCPRTIKIPTEDPDGDKVRCRWSVGSSECGGACQAFNYGFLDEEHCTIRYNGNGYTGWYAVALMLEDYPQSTNDFSAVSPFSSIGLQFLVKIASYSGPCYRKPYFTGSTPASDSCVEINIGSTYRASIEVKHVDSARSVVEIHIVAPTGVQTTAVGSTNDSYGEVVYQRNISWTPSSSQTDQNIFCFTALDNYGIESDKRCITILVGNNRASPVAILSSRHPNFVKNYNYYAPYDDWNIAFDRTIKKPRKSSYIRVYVNDTVIFKLDTSSSPYVTVGGVNNTVLSFRTPRDVLSMRGTYSIILDAGSVVGRGCSSDGPPTPGITTPNLWKVYTYGYCSPGYYRGWNTGCVDVNECMNPAIRRRRSVSETTGSEAETGLGRQKRHIYAYYGASTAPNMSSVLATPASSIEPSPSVQVSTSVSVNHSAFYQLITSSTGYIRSPNYPNNYGANQDCIWNITVAYGYVQLYFFSFDVESCPWDHLDIIDGWSLNHRRIGRYCGHNVPPTIIYSSGRYMILHFRSDHSVHHKGFNIYYWNVHSAPKTAVNLSSTPVQMQITPTPVQSVAPSASAVYSPFVLHLPANCEHYCMNTAGSYYCRCHAGYKLNSDGKTCSDIDECQVNNGGCSHHCQNVPGSYYCYCMEGHTISSDNKTCTEPGIEVTCEEEFMQIDLERVYYKNFDPTHLHLNYQGCRATSNSTHISLRTSLSGCWTTFNESDDTIRFDNVVKAKKLIIQNVVTRSFDVNIPFYCIYSKHKMLHVSFKPFGIITGSEGGFGNFTFKMDLFKSNAYRYPYAANDYPISVQLNQLLYIQYSVESLQSSLVVFAETCRATPSRDPYSSPQYVFLRNGCPEDTTIAYSYYPRPVQRLTMRAFEFLADYPVVYLHCHVMACHRNTIGSRCSQGCRRFARKKRELANQETEITQNKETMTYTIGSGPIHFKTENSKESEMEKARAATIAGATSASGVLLIIVIILAAIVIRKGYVKKFNRRNKVDDIYSRENSARTNAYVNEGNTAEGSEIETRDEDCVVRDDIWVDKIDHPSESGC